MTSGDALVGKVAVVTGGSSRGAGFYTCRLLIENGARVAVFARGEERLREAAAELGNAAVPIVCDVSDPDSVRSAFSTVEREFDGRLDILVNNAAVAWPHAIDEVSDEQLMAEVGTNLLGPILTTRAAVPLMERHGGGDIINISSESAHDPFPHLTIYAATKAGLETLTEGLIGELKHRGIRLTLLCSGNTAGGEFSAHWDPDARTRAMQSWEQLGYLARVAGAAKQPPQRVAEAVVFACSRPAGSMIDVMHVRAHS